jgi:hypothetical protein
MSMKTQDLIRYISWYATENDLSLTTVRLVKFVYLADVYFARRHEGETLTHLPWIFLYYGPYCSEVMRELDGAVSQGLIDRKSLESRYEEEKEFHLYKCTDESGEELEEEIPLEVLGPLKAAIRRYGEDTPLLLDHVYFETEPMIEANKGDILDFTKCKPIVPSRPIELKKISKEKITLAKRRVKALALKFEQGRLTKESEKAEGSKWKDDVYYQALEVMDGQDLEIGLTGIAKIVK